MRRTWCALTRSYLRKQGGVHPGKVKQKHIQALIVSKDWDIINGQVLRIGTNLIAPNLKIHKRCENLSIPCNVFLFLPNDFLLIGSAFG